MGIKGNANALKTYETPRLPFVIKLLLHATPQKRSMGNNMQASINIENAVLYPVFKNAWTQSVYVYQVGVIVSP